MILCAVHVAAYVMILCAVPIMGSHCAVHVAEGTPGRF